MDMDLSPTLCEFKPGVIMMYPEYFIGIVFENIRYSGLKIFLDYDGIVIYRPHLFCYTFERDRWISRDPSSGFQQFLNILPMVICTGKSHKQRWSPITLVHTMTDLGYQLRSFVSPIGIGAWYTLIKLL
jgi:hypothetical protein